MIVGADNWIGKLKCRTNVLQTDLVPSAGKRVCAFVNSFTFESCWMERWREVFKSSTNRPFSLVMWVYRGDLNPCRLHQKNACEHEYVQLWKKILSWVSSHDLYWENKIDKWKSSTYVLHYPSLSVQSSWTSTTLALAINCSISIVAIGQLWYFERFLPFLISRCLCFCNSCQCPPIL